MHVEVFINLTHGGTVEKKIFLYLFWSQISIILLIFFLIHILKLYQGRYLKKYVPCTVSKAGPQGLYNSYDSFHFLWYATVVVCQ